MYDATLAIEILTQLVGATETIIRRFKPFQSAEEFTNSEAGMEKFDSICMQLIAIGEGLNNLDKVTQYDLLPLYGQVDWRKAKGTTRHPQPSLL